MAYCKPSTSGRQNSPLYLQSRRPFGCKGFSRLCSRALAQASRNNNCFESNTRGPRIDYVGLMRRYESQRDTCPPLFLAPMENLADRPFRRALSATIGGFDEACTEFIRVPGRTDHPAAAIRGITAWYDADELGGVPLGAQIMGSDPELMGMAAAYLAQVKGAPRVDLNCGCPANTVTGNGAGSSLLRSPERLGAIVRSMVAAVGGAVPVSVKLRAGFNDTALFEENLLAAQESGAAFVTLHPRTKQQGYSGTADWELTARAVQLLDIPVVGNGDVVSVEAAHAILRQTGCAALMLGRGAVADPLLAHRIRFSFTNTNTTTAAAAGGCAPSPLSATWPWDEPEAVQAFLRAYAAHIIPELATESPVPVEHHLHHHHQQQQQQGHERQQGHDQQQSRQQQFPANTDSFTMRCGSGSCDDGDGNNTWRSEGTGKNARQSAGTVGSGAGLQGMHTIGADPHMGSFGDLSSGSGSGTAASPGSIPTARAAGKFGRLKMVMRYLFSGSPELTAECDVLLRLGPGDCSVGEMLERMCGAVAAHWPAGGPRRRVMVDHMGAVAGSRELVGAGVRAAG